MSDNAALGQVFCDYFASLANHSIDYSTLIIVIILIILFFYHHPELVQLDKL
jgi:hypothetical protein